ncbi:NAD(P)-binding protein [Heliocybe sulcata]|uniref:NAD(P)-binding protein n=1 Tax=Heliocybe sulcata TaxID=5364 RepID=A0A5C3MQR3_9AGAM|nr:NAD(P)-binding protein [Heliocybe sulcata]
MIEICRGLLIRLKLNRVIFADTYRVPLSTKCASKSILSAVKFLPPMSNLQASKSILSAGRVALVTGGGTGIGNIIARGLAANGAKVYITGRRKEVLEKAATDVASTGLRLVPLLMDVTDKDTIRSAVEVVKGEEGKLHVLVNNAGMQGPRDPHAANPSAPERKNIETYSRHIFESQSYDEWNATYQTNVSAIFFVTYAFLALLEAGARDLGQGETTSIVNISSGAGTWHLPRGRHCYLATKAAVNHLSVSMATDFALEKVPVRVNVISPGYFKSEMSPPVMEELIKTDIVFPGTVSSFPTKRSGREEEMIVTVLGLVTSGYTNGQIVNLDGGASLVNP